MKMTERIKDTVRLSMGTILVFLSILTTTIMGFQYVKSLAEENKADVAEHKITDEKRWDKNDEHFASVQNDIDKLESFQTELRIMQGKQAAQFAHIQSELGEIKLILTSFERGSE